MHDQRSPDAALCLAAKSPHVGINPHLTAYSCRRGRGLFHSLFEPSGTLDADHRKSPRNFSKARPPIFFSSHPL
jgi:hypothetical protein